MMTVDKMIGILEGDRELHSITSFTPARNYAKRRILVTRIGRPNGRSKSEDFRVTVGPPNYRERQFLKECRKAECHPKAWKGWHYPKKRTR